MKLFVARLDYGVTSDALRTVFEDFGTVNTANVINDRDTGQSRGFGFVEMPNQEEAMNAIHEADGMELRGREIVVKQAEDRNR
jgi:RNA recognition motif-containing protein